MDYPTEIVQYPEYTGDEEQGKHGGEQHRKEP